MNFITESNRLNIDVNKTVASSQVKEKSKTDPFARENGQNSFIRKWPYSVLKTSPITHTSDSKVVAKRKKRQNWSKMVSEFEERGICRETSHDGNACFLSLPKCLDSIELIFLYYNEQLMNHCILTYFLLFHRRMIY